jgi:Fur family peroxide stress response transcriptional regulator
MRRTRQREVIRQVVRHTDCHPAADFVYEAVRRELPGVSLGTVYRNLKLLADKGELRVLEGAGGTLRYDACTRNHYHFICDKCGRIFDLDLPPETRLERRVAETTGFKVRCHTLEFRGVCSDCRTSGKPGHDGMVESAAAQKEMEEL